MPITLLVVLSLSVLMAPPAMASDWVVVTPSTLDFGTVAPGSNVTREVVVTTLTSVSPGASVIRGAPGVELIKDTCSGTIVPSGGTCVFDLWWKAGTQTGPLSGELYFNYNGPGMGYGYTVPMSGMVAAAPPSPPLGVSVVRAKDSAIVSWRPPVSNGTSPILGFSVTSTPQGGRARQPVSCPAP